MQSSKEEIHWLNSNDAEHPGNPLDGDPTISYKYDQYGNIRKVTDARGKTTSTEYDGDTRTYPVTITNPLGHTISYGYNIRTGQVLTETNANANITRYTYDLFGRASQVDFPDGGRKTVEYHDDVFPSYILSRTWETEPGANESTIDSYSFFDGLGRPVQTVSFGADNTPVVSRAYYDIMGRNDYSEGPFFSSGAVRYPMPPDPARHPANEIPYVSKQFDDRGRLSTVATPDKNSGAGKRDLVTRYSYLGLSTTVTDPDNARKTETRNYLGQLIKVTEYPAGSTGIITRYANNAAGELLSVTDSAGVKISIISYDTLGRKISMSDKDMGFWQYEYDPNGNLVQQTDAMLQRTVFAYDDLNRIISRSHENLSASTASAPQVIYAYDDILGACRSSTSQKEAAFNRHSK